MSSPDDGIRTGIQITPPSANILLDLAIAELAVAQAQRAPTDDQIIAEHIDMAHRFVAKARRLLRGEAL